MQHLSMPAAAIKLVTESRSPILASVKFQTIHEKKKCINNRDNINPITREVVAHLDKKQQIIIHNQRTLVIGSSD